MTAGTSYLVYHVDGDKLILVRDVIARSGEHAIRQVAADDGTYPLTDGTYAAVPARSLTVRQVTTETTTRVRVKAA